MSFRLTIQGILRDITGLERKSTAGFSLLDNESEPIESGVGFQQWLDSLERFSSLLKERSVRVVLLSPIPDFTQEWERVGTCHNEWFISSKNSCSVNKNDQLIYSAAINDSIRSFELLSDRSTVRILSLMPGLCPDTEVCYFEKDGTSLYRDGNHLSSFSIETIAVPALIREIKQFD